MQPIQSNCKYLFGKEASEIFPGNKHTKFIESCMDLLMKVHLLFLEKKDGFFLLVPRAGNDQCHLYCLKALQIQKKYKESSISKEQRNDENRYIHLCMLLSFPMTNNRHHYANAVNKMLNEFPIAKELLTNSNKKKKFTSLILDNDQRLEKAARLALIELFKSNLEQDLKTNDNDPLYQELYSLSQENLSIESSRVIKDKSSVYTYPGFASILHFFNRIEKEKIPFVIKVKVLSEKGAAGIITILSRKIEDDEKTLVIEAFATDGSSLIPGTNHPFTISNCKEEAKKCPSYFMRYEGHSLSKLLHNKEEDCFYCKETSMDLSLHQMHIENATKDPKELFYALGRSSLQENFKQFFKDGQKYPQLTNLFSDSEKLVQKLGFDQPTTFSGCHMHLDDGKHAKSEEFQFDMTPEQLLKSRGIL